MAHVQFDEDGNLEGVPAPASAPEAVVTAEENVVPVDENLEDSALD